MAGVGGFGGTQIIGGKTYTMYSPEWYAAQNAYDTQQAGQKGTNAGTEAGAAITALRGAAGDMFGGGSSSSSSSSSATTPAAPARVAMPGMPAVAPGSTPGAPAAPTGMPAGYTPGGTGAVTLNTPDMTAADDAAFSRARDTVGQTTRASLTALRSALGGRGQLGGGGELRGTASVVNEGQRELADTSRQRAITEGDRAAHNAELSYTGNITQRGQNMTAAEAADALAARLKEVSYQGDITQRGQDISAMQGAQSQALAEKQQQQAVLDRILSALTPLY